MSRPDWLRGGEQLARPSRRRALLAAPGALLGAVAAPSVLGAAPAAASSPVQAMHGFADQQGILLWLQGQRAQSLSVQVRPAAKPGAPAMSFAVELDARLDCTATVSIAGLEPGTAYRYEVRPASGGAALASGEFRTQVLWQWRTDPPTVRIVAGSCNYLNDFHFDRPGPSYGAGEEIFDVIAGTRSDLMLWLGDNIYLRESEWTSLEGVSRRYRYHRWHEKLRKVWTATPHVAIWDDHDFGPNDSDASYSGKGWTQEMFRRYWPMPYSQHSGGLYGSCLQGDVELFLLDDRSNRYPNRWPQGPDKVMYGGAQMQWLKAALTSSQAPFKLVCGGNQFWNRVPGRAETWAMFPHEQAELRRFLDEQKIPGVIFLSGDRHFASLLRVERPGLYPIHELTTSPLTAGPTSNVDAELANPDLVPGTMYNDRNFALITVTGPRTARQLAIELMDTRGQKKWEWRATAAELAVGTGRGRT